MLPSHKWDLNLEVKSCNDDDEDTLQKKDDADSDADTDDADDHYNLFFSYGKGGRCFFHCPGSSKGCAPHWKDWKV